MSDGYRYACCAHCEHDYLDYDVDGHDDRCPEGCNDGEGAA